MEGVSGSIPLPPTILTADQERTFQLMLALYFGADPRRRPNPRKTK